MALTPAEQRAWEAVSAVEDPEIPVLTLVDLGIVNSIVEQGEVVEVTLLPTYSGCPATDVIKQSVELALENAGLKPRVHHVMSPTWSTDFITPTGRQKLTEYGIAPSTNSVTDKRALSGHSRSVACPRCGSVNTTLVSAFGSTPCKAHFKCADCLEPFDYFKCL